MGVTKKSGLAHELVDIFETSTSIIVDPHVSLVKKLAIGNFVGPNRYPNDLSPQQSVLVPRVGYFIMPACGYGSK